jgi:hypothetical protein
LEDTVDGARTSVMKASVFGSRDSSFSCILFWHEGNGYPDLTFENCVNGLFRESVKYSHSFVASRCLPSQTVRLYEIQPGTPASRVIPSCRVTIGATEFDFSALKTGSAFLFGVPALSVPV